MDSNRLSLDFLGYASYTSKSSLKVNDNACLDLALNTLRLAYCLC
jgi:hypothetical protein